MTSPRSWPFDDDDRSSGSVRPLSQADLQAILAHLGGGLLGNLLTPWLGLVVAGLAALVTGWGLRFQPSPAAIAWRRGAAGERRTARLLGPLERHGWAILHDLAVPGSAANIDHLAIGPGGVFVIDSKQYRGRLQLDPSGRLWHGRYPLAPALGAVSFEADQAAQILLGPERVTELADQARISFRAAA
jgi:hypothetical protein